MESLVASGRTLDKKLARLQRQVTTYFLDAPVITYHDKPISLAELRQGYQLCEDSKALAFYVGCSAPIKATAHTVTAQPSMFLRQNCPSHRSSSAKCR